MRLADDGPGVYGELATAFNEVVVELVQPTREMARVIGAVARGDLSKKITVEVRGEILELKNTINTMVDQLNAFAAEVTRVAREVGGQVRSRMGDNVERLMREPHGASGGAQAAATAAPGAPAPARYDTEEPCGC